MDSGADGEASLPSVATAQATGAEARFQALLEAAPDAIVVVDAAGRIVLANAQVERWFGYTRQELVGRPVEILVPDRLRLAHRQHRARYAGAPSTRPMGVGLELAARRKDGGEVPVEISLSPLETEDGPIVIAIVRDISQRRQAEAALRQSELAHQAAEAKRLQLLQQEAALHEQMERLKDEFIANISHDLRTPVAAIKASIGVVLANEPAGMPAELHRLLVNVEHASDQLEQLVSDLIDLTRLQAGRVRLELDRCDARALTLRAASEIEVLARSRGQRVEVAVPSRPVWLTADPVRLERALVNLLSNAHKYGRPGGRIDVSLRYTRQEVVFTVADDGEGIPEAEQERIFWRFYRRQDEGTQRTQGSGLGLAITRALVERHGGRIWVESRPGEGASFFIALPRKVAPAAGTVAGGGGVSGDPASA